MHKLPLAALPALVLGPAVAIAESPYLFVIPAERLLADSAPLAPVVQATLHVPDAERAVDIIAAGGAIEVVAAGDGEVTVAFAGRQTLAGEPDARDHGDSFVIDYAETAVARLADALQRDFGARPTAAELAEFVFRHIADKTYMASFDLASKVAATGSGDCTEHAVLLTALARATGHAARVALGVVLVEFEHDIAAFGHAWTEIHDGSGWQIADATRPGDEPDALSVRYLPFINLDDEGPGFGLDLARLARIQPARISRITSTSVAEAKR